MTKAQHIKYAETKARKKAKRRRMLFHRRRNAGFVMQYHPPYTAQKGKVAPVTEKIGWLKRLINWIKGLWS